jgi:PIN domain nuclease of toxin-antitoxin system
LTVLDASALISLLGGEPAADTVADLIRRRPPASISGANLAEVVDHLIRVDGRPADVVNDEIDLLIAAGLDIEPYWLTHARRAAVIRANYYHRTKNPISLADAACIATARLLATDLATTDPALARTALDLGVEVIRLPDSSGATN